MLFFLLAVFFLGIAVCLCSSSSNGESICVLEGEANQNIQEICIRVTESSWNA